MEVSLITGDCSNVGITYTAPVSVWLKVMWLKRAKIGKEPLSIKNFSTAPSTFNKCEQKHGPSEQRDGNSHVFAKSC
jgi:hypothetical protein